MEIQSYYWSFIQDLNMASSYLVSLSWWVRQPANIDWISWSVWFSHFSFSSLPRQSKNAPWWSSRGPYRRDLFSLWLWSLHCRLCEQCLHQGQGRGRGGVPRKDAQILVLKTCCAVTPTKHRVAGAEVKTCWEPPEQSMSEDLFFLYFSSRGAAHFPSHSEWGWFRANWPKKPEFSGQGKS